MTLSATAIKPSVSYAPPAMVTSDPAVAEAWFLALPPLVQKRLEEKLTAIYHGLPPAVQLAIQRDIIASGEKVVINPTVDGLGQWGTTLVALANVGASIFNTVASGRLQKDIAAGADSTQTQIAAAQAEANKQAQLALIEAQTEAVRLKAQQTAVSQATFRSYLPYILAGAGVLGLAFVAIKALKRPA